jgi:hypothetical protein
MDGESRFGESVVRELPVAVHLNEPSPMEIPEVAGDGGLGKLEEVDKVADAELPGDEQIQDPDPGWIGEAAEEEIEVCDRIGDLRGHVESRICVGGYNLAKRM